MAEQEIRGYVVIEEDGTEEEAMEEDVTEGEAVEEEDGIEEEATGEVASDEEVMNEMAEDYGPEFVYNNDFGINSMEQIGLVEFVNLEADDVGRFHFGDVDLAYEFYSAYAKNRGFSARKSKTRFNRKGKLMWKMFVCFREGYRPKKYYNLQNRKKEPRAETRCGCNARLEVRFDGSTSRWVVVFFSDEHNHQCLEPRFYGMLPSHRKMKEPDVGQMNNMRSGGISTTHIYGALAHQSGGYQYVGFRKRNMYNKIARKNRLVPGDGNAALAFLEEMSRKDPCFYFKQEKEGGGALRNLFWSDGRSQLDYKVFGDVLAFDATYKKNKYSCPLVVFSGVNHHNQTVVFAAALVSNEREETYVWLLEQFLEAMKGKPPVSVITDGDTAMKNAIGKVFHNAHHRLCAWHLLRNATSNIGKPRFTSMFKKLMLGDYEIGVFCRKWFKMVEEFGVQDKTWIIELYEKRHMWATAHIRGKFFAGFRTTSRCEGLHAIIAKYVKSRYNLAEFLIHFDRCLDYLRHREFEADFDSAKGVPVMQTNLEPLEKSASDVYTREVFFLFRPILVRASTMKVLESKDIGSYVIYVVAKYARLNNVWHVLFCEELMEFKCSCLRMESLGIPCEHIVAVLVFLDICELPNSLVMARWMKDAKAGVLAMTGSMWDSLKCSQYSCLIDWFRQLSSLSAGRSPRFTEMRDFAISTIARYTNEDLAQSEVQDFPVGSSNNSLGNLRNCKTKGRSGERSKRKPQRCRVCRMEGHNRTTCPIWQEISQDAVTDHSMCLSLEDEGMDNTNEEESLAEIGATSEEENEDYESFVDLAANV